MTKQMKYRTVRLEGALSRYGKVHTIRADNLQQIISCLSQLNGFRADIYKNSYQIFLDEKDIKPIEAHMPLGDVKEIRIVPSASGAATPYEIFAVASIVLFVGGVLFALTIDYDDEANEADDRASDTYTGAINMQAQGTPLPYAYGECFAGSVVIGSSVTVADKYENQNIQFAGKNINR